MNSEVKRLYSLMLSSQYILGSKLTKIISSKTEPETYLSVDKKGNSEVVHFVEITFEYEAVLRTGMKSVGTHSFSLGTSNE